MMSNFSGLTVPKGSMGEKRMDNGGVFKFKYPVVVNDH